MNTNPRMERWASAAGEPTWTATNKAKGTNTEDVLRRGWNMRAPEVLELEIPADAVVTEMKSPAGAFQHVNIYGVDVNIYGNVIIPGMTLTAMIGVMMKSWEPVTNRADALRCWAWYLKCEPCNAGAEPVGKVMIHNTRSANYAGRKYKDICDGTNFAFVSSDGKMDQHIEIIGANTAAEPKATERRPRREKQPTAMAAALQAAGVVTDNVAQ